MSPYSFSENMLGVLKKLKLLLEREKVPYMLIGGIAVALWGEPHIATIAMMNIYISG